MVNNVTTADNTPQDPSPELIPSVILGEVNRYAYASGDLRTLFYCLENGIEEYENLELSRYHIIDIKEDEDVVETVDILDLDTFDASEDMSQVWENATEIQKGTLLHLYPHEVLASLGIQIESSTMEVQEFIEGLLAEDSDLITSPSMLPIYLDALSVEREDSYPLVCYGDLAKYRKGVYVYSGKFHFHDEKEWLPALSQNYPLESRFSERFIANHNRRGILDLFANSALCIDQFWYYNFDPLTAVIECADPTRSLDEQRAELDNAHVRPYTLGEVEKIVSAIKSRYTNEQAMASLGRYYDLEQCHYNRYHKDRTE